MSKKIRTITYSVLIAVMLLAVTVSAAFAAPPMDIHIEATESIGISGEAFEATGSAVDSGAICSTGTVDDLSVEVSGPPSGSFRILKVLKRFTCDGGGTFDVSLIVRLDLTTNETTARWNIVGGTGAYAGLKGNGSLVGTPIVPGTSIQDVYDGRVY